MRFSAGQTKVPGNGIVLPGPAKDEVERSVVGQSEMARHVKGGKLVSREIEILFEPRSSKGADALLNESHMWIPKFLDLTESGFDQIFVFPRD